VTTNVRTAALASPNTAAILTYHPPIFSGLKSLTSSTPLQASLLQCIVEGVSIFTIHTAADNAVGGVNDFMGTGLLLAAGAKAPEEEAAGCIRPGQGNGIRALTEVKNTPDGHDGCGGGRIVNLEEGGGKALSWEEAIEAVKSRLGLKHSAPLPAFHSQSTVLLTLIPPFLLSSSPLAVQAARSSTGSETINTIAICAGSGGGVLKGVQADLWLTGELGHVRFRCLSPLPSLPSLPPRSANHFVWILLMHIVHLQHDILAANAKGIHVFCCTSFPRSRPRLLALSSLSVLYLLVLQSLTIS
jgi:putative NIF3 family GTP cyclohydrolase 1 type 2